MNEPIKVYDLKEVASILKINLRVLRRYIKENKIVASKIGRKYVITAEDLEAYLNGNSNKADAYIELNVSKASAGNNARNIRALSEVLLEKARQNESEEVVITLEEFNTFTGIKTTEEKLEELIEELFKYEAITETEIKGNKTTSKASLISSYYKMETEKGETCYVIELSKVLVKHFKENMLINTKILRESGK